MSAAETVKKAAALEKRLGDKRFLGGDVPGAEDAKAFKDLLGDNMYVARWAKNMASYTTQQRAQFAKAAPVKIVPKSAKEELEARKNTLLASEAEVQKRWEAEKVFELDPPKEGEKCEGKYMATFPYPYMNGKLHLGHAFTVLKAEFAVGYNRLLGKKSLYPFAFHCTGMPIQAAANKLKNDYARYGSPCPKFPCGKPCVRENDEGEVMEVEDASILNLMWSPPTATNHTPVTGYSLYKKDPDASEWIFVVKVGAEKIKVGKKERVVAEVPGLDNGKYVFRAVTHLEDGTDCEPSGASDIIDPAKVAKDNQKTTGKKKKGPAKLAVKSGDALHQWDIMRGMGMKEEDITAFTDPMKWLTHFPPQGKEDLKKLGVRVDFRRAFITTSVNPYYDAFVRWQFNKLKAGGYLAFGKRPTIYSEVDKQACMDHDRSEGEGGAPTEYTAVKTQVLEPMPEVLKPMAAKGKPIYLLCATLRPETMIGQTNIWILPEGKYGVFDRGDELVACSLRSARSMCFQDLFEEFGKLVQVGEFLGSEIMGATIKAPVSVYEKMHVLPLTTIKMNKGTGIVTSVPADSPADYAALMDLQNEKKREFYKVKAEWVLPFKPVPLIDVVIDGENREMCAAYLHEKLGITSQKDVDKLEEAKDIAYNSAFYKGVMSAGEFKGMPVCDAKLACRAKMIANKEAFIYHEPDRMIKSRSGDECVVALIDQWYLKYGEDEWKAKVMGHVKGQLDTYSPACKKAFEEAVDWLKEWACSRSFGLGTQIPWDEQFVIESLSDSTIYMAYYSLAKFFHGTNNLAGTERSPYGIEATSLNDAVFDYIFLKGEYPEGCKISKELMDEMRTEFEFWYPMDLRVSGKDLIQNHLTMCLYNHAAIWKDAPEMWPRSMYTNGWVLVDNEKMSKSKGNFLSLEESVNMFSADAVRMGCANAGDSMEDANFEVPMTEKCIKKLYAFQEFAKKHVTEKNQCRVGEKTLFVDQWFDNEMSRLVEEANTFYNRMQFKEALRCCWFDFHSIKDHYFDVLSEKPLVQLIDKWIKWCTIMISIIAPHTAEVVWATIGEKGSVHDARFPVPEAWSKEIVAKGTYLEKVKGDLIEKHAKAEKQKKGAQLKNCNMYIAVSYPDWKLQVVNTLKDDMKDGQFSAAVMKKFDKKYLEEAGDKLLLSKGKQVGQFAGMIKAQAVAEGPSAFDLEMPYEELPLVNEHINYLKSKIKADTLTVYLATAENIPDAAPAENAVPGKPGFAFN